MPAQHLVRSIDELRRFSAALSAFVSRYDELQNHISFVKSSVDSKLSNHVTNTNQTPLVHVLESEICCEDINALKEHAETTDRLNIKYQFKTEETVFDQTVTTVTKIIVSEQRLNGTVADCEQMHQNVRTPECLDVLKKPEEIDTLMTEKIVLKTACDQTVTAVAEGVVSGQRLNGTISGCGHMHQNVRIPENIEEIDVFKKPKVVDVLENYEEIDTLEDIVLGTCCDQTITDAPEAVVLGKRLIGMANNCERSHEYVRTPESLEEKVVLKDPEVMDVSKKPEVINAMKKRVSKIPEVMDESKNLEVMDALKKCVSKNAEVINASKKREVIDALKKRESKNTEVNDVSKKHEQTSILNKPKETNFCNNPVETDLLKKREVINTSKKPDQTDLCKNLEEIDTLQKQEEIGIKNKATKTETSKKSVISVLEFLCQSMRSKEMKKHVATHISEMLDLRDEIAKALKLAKDPAKLVLDSIGGFYVQGSKSFCNGSGNHLKHQKSGRLASVLILECFVMISSDGIEITKRDRGSAAAVAGIWRKRMIREGGLRHTDGVDARGLLLFISGFGIQDHIFTVQDITDLIRASNVKGLAAALRRSVFLMPKIPDVISFMVKSDMEIEAVNIAYTLGLEDSCHPHDILTTYLHNKIKDIRNGSYFQMLDAMKQQLLDLRSVKQCLESHNIDPSILLPEFKINEKLQNLEKEINDRKLNQKRKSSDNPIHKEPKRACLGHKKMSHQQKHADHYDMNTYSRSTPPSTIHFDFDRNLSINYNHSPSSVYHAAAATENIHVPMHNSPAVGFHGSNERMVYADDVPNYGSRERYDQHYSRHGQTYDSPDDVQQYGWHGQYDQHFSRHGQTYDSQSYGRPSRRGPLESSPGYLDTPLGFPGRRCPSSDLYRFADTVEKDSRRFRSSGSNAA